MKYAEDTSDLSTNETTTKKRIRSKQFIELPEFENLTLNTMIVDDDAVIESPNNDLSISKVQKTGILRNGMFYIRFECNAYSFF